MPPAYWSRAWKTKPWMRRLSGLTLEPSTADRGVASWIASLAATRASQTASPGKGLAKPTTDGLPTTSCASSMSAGLPVYSGRTSQGTPTASLAYSSLHWNGWATALRLEYSQRRKSAPVTDGNGFSSWPTADAGLRDGYNTSPGPAGARPTLMRSAKQWQTPRAIYGEHPGMIDPSHLTGQAIGAQWGTPSVADTTGTRERRGGERSDELLLKGQAKAWGTPRASDGEKGGPNQSFGAGGTPLPSMAANWPSATASDWKGSGPAMERSDGKMRGDRLDYAAERLFSPQAQTIPDGRKSSETARTLNPLFVEWLMGWPTGLTDCEHAVTGFSLWLRRSRGALLAMCSREQRQTSLF